MIDKGILLDYLESAFKETTNEMLDVGFAPNNEKRKAYELGQHDAIAEIIAEVRTMNVDVVETAWKEAQKEVEKESVVKKMSERMEQLFINEFNKANKKIEELEKQNRLLAIENNRLKVEIDLLTKGKILNEIKKETRDK